MCPEPSTLPVGGPVLSTYHFGAFTQAGQGGVAMSGAAIVFGDPAGHWQISDGLLSPSPAGAAAMLSDGPYLLQTDSGQAVLIRIVANRYTVRTGAELTERLRSLGPALAGRQIGLRFNGGQRYEHSWILLDDYTTPVTLTAETGEEMPTVHNLTIGRTENNVILRGLRFYRRRDEWNQTGKYCLANLFGAHSITFDGCVFDGGIPASSWSAPTPGAFGLSGINVVGGHNIQITQCVFQDLVHAIPMLAASHCLVTHNQVRRYWGDFINVSPQYGSKRHLDQVDITISDNFAADYIGNYDTFLHADFVQIYDRANAGGTGRLVDLTIDRNVMLPGQLHRQYGKQYRAQGIVAQTQGAWTGGIHNAKIRDNLLLCESIWGIGNFDDRVVFHNSEISGNTIVPVFDATSYPDHRPGIRVNMSGGALRDNASQAIQDQYHTGTGATVVADNPQLLGLVPDDPASFQTWFVGPDFDPASKNAALAAFARHA